ncbi:hypothetical protein B0I35DRAFT_485378 [Stachybotrys elegans]|uniref:Uncharacterized protein n=1 Tax=Stachybotrys elegans TaxID=80388 RepID=A0A8K0WKA5_9HYPO|nr:hypothetical protein B0I35DRAFT_485378 [Stachybotrys elegans]
MKFTVLAKALAAIPLFSTSLASPLVQGAEVAEVEKRACELKVQWTDNWFEVLTRYQVKLITTPRIDNLLAIYCDAFANTRTDDWDNLQCYWNGGHFYLDASFSWGSAGHDNYLRTHEEAAQKTRERSGCNVVLNI